MDGIKHSHDPGIQTKLTDLSAKLQELETRSQKDMKDFLDSYQATMAVFEMRLQEMESKKASIRAFCQLQELNNLSQ